jgi:DNA-binding transcriptional LysR family regulator
MLTLKELQVLTQVAELGSVTNVAAKLGVAQSAISRQIAELEAKIGGRLFHRTGRGLVETELTKSILPKAKALLVDVRRLTDDVKARSGIPIGTVTVGLVPGVVAPLASLLFNRLRGAFPRIRINVFEGYSGEIDQWLAEGKIDVGVLNRYRSAAQIRFQSLFTADVLLVGAAASKHLKSGTIDFKALAGVPLVDTVTPHNLTGLLHDLSRQHGVTLSIATRVDSASAVYDLIAHSGLHATLPHHAVATQLADGTFKSARIVNPSITQKVVLATSTARPLSVAARQVTKVLLELAGILPESQVPAGHRTAA